jgi:hypothetical protein
VLPVLPEAGEGLAGSRKRVLPAPLEAEEQRGSHRRGPCHQTYQQEAEVLPVLPEAGGMRKRVRVRKRARAPEETLEQQEQRIHR